MKKKSTIFTIVYATVLWILTNLISSIIFVVQETIVGSTSWNNFIFYLFFGLLLSSPAFIFLALIINFFTTNKLILVFISILLVFLSFYIYGFELKLSTLITPTIYSIVLSCLILLLSIRK